MFTFTLNWQHVRRYVVQILAALVAILMLVVDSRLFDQTIWYHCKPCAS